MIVGMMGKRNECRERKKSRLNFYSHQHLQHLNKLFVYRYQVPVTSVQAHETVISTNGREENLTLKNREREFRPEYSRYGVEPAHSR